jgi:serine/threonine protein kinase
MRLYPGRMDSRARQPEDPDAPVISSGTMPSTLGRYQVVCELARGGMSIVYLTLARGPAQFNKLLVLKQLNPALALDPALVSMFLAEARLAARLSHPNIVQTIEVGTDDSCHYIVMEYLDGQPFSRLLSRARRSGVTLPLYLKLAVIAGALEGLAYVHGLAGFDGKWLGLVHRDVSPHNVFVTYDGQIKLLDFGIAKATDGFEWTRTGFLKGKVAYMAPEQAAGDRVDARGDVFAVGVMLFEAVTGRRYWSHATGDLQILRSLVDGDLPSRRPGALDGVPLGLGSLIQKCTAPDPSLRYENAAAVLADLAPVLRRLLPPAFDPHAIGHCLRDLFADDRARLLATLQTQSVAPDRARAAPPFDPRLGESDTALARSSSNPPVVGTIVSVPVHPSLDRSARRTRAWLVVAATAAIGATGILATRGHVHAGTAVASAPVVVARIVRPAETPGAQPEPTPSSALFTPTVDRGGAATETRAPAAWSRTRFDGRAFAGSPSKGQSCAANPPKGATEMTNPSTTPDRIDAIGRARTIDLDNPYNNRPGP